MSKPPLPEAAMAMLRKPNPGVITTLRPDGQPVAMATWYLWDNGRVLVSMDEGRKRLEHIRIGPEAAVNGQPAGRPVAVVGALSEGVGPVELALRLLDRCAAAALRQFRLRARVVAVRGTRTRLHGRPGVGRSARRCRRCGEEAHRQGARAECHGGTSPEISYGVSCPFRSWAGVANAQLGIRAKHSLRQSRTCAAAGACICTAGWLSESPAVLRD